MPHQFPIIPGWDVAGEVVALGPEARGFEVGDRVFAYARGAVVKAGTYAELIALPTTSLARIPLTLAYEEAAAVPLVALTAWQALFDFAGLKAGESLLVTGGAGGVGSFAVQFGKWAGARVITTASERNREYVLGLGAEKAVDYTTEDVMDAVHEDFEKGVDVVFDCVGNDSLDEAWELVREGGRLVSIVSPPDEARAREKNVKAGYVFVSPNGLALETIARLIAEGKVKLPQISVRSIRDAAAAQEENKARHVRGKVVLAIDF